MVSDDKNARDAYQRKRETERNRNANKSRTGRDIGTPPPPKNPARRAEAEGSLRAFLLSYFPARFPLAFSADHDEVIRDLEKIASDGGLEAFGMPRGSGKTTLSECAAIWALVTGRRKFVALIGASEDAAKLMLASIKGELEDNDLLAEDFPEVCFPIRAIEGIANRCNGQTSNGERTKIKWSDTVVILPTIAGSKASGSILVPRGITGRVRGMKHRLPTGEQARPDLAIIDDPQTDESARSPSQCTKRLRVVCGAILGLAGPGRKIAAFMPCTVIARGDLADQVLDCEKRPEWHGRLAKMVYAFPTDQALWDRYADIRRQDMRAGGHGEKATAFYIDNREAMDAGAVMGWAERYNADEVSAVQNAQNLLIDNPATFAAEYQNEPLDDEPAEAKLPTVDVVAAKVSGYPRGECSLECEHVTAFIDVQERLLYYMIAAWSPSLTGEVIEYGTWPEQPRAYFTYADARKTLKHEFPRRALGGQLRGGLEALTKYIAGRKFTRQPDGAKLQVRRLLIDSGDQSSDIYKFCRETTVAGILPSKGKGITADKTPIAEWKKRDGATIGLQWQVGKVENNRGVRLVTFDTHFWKKRLHDGLEAAVGDVGCLRLYGDGGTDHQMLAEHLVASESRVKTEGGGRVVWVYSLKPGRPDNHFLDCAVGCMVAASMEGCSPDRAIVRKPKPKPPPRPPRRRVSYL